MKTLKVMSACVALLTLAACNEPQCDQYGCQQQPGMFGMGQKQTIGTFAGAGAGALIGSNIGGGRGAVVGTALGTLLGAGIGSSIGASMDRADMAYYNRASVSALENGRTGQEVRWQNPDNGHYGTITPTRTYQAEDGVYCREYTQRIYVGGQAKTGYGHACRQPDGNWKIVD